MLLSGHTHKFEIVRSNGKTVVFCPSVSVSLPKDEHSFVGFCVLDLRGGEWGFSVLPVEFDCGRLAEDFIESGLIDMGRYWSRGVIKSMLEKQDYSLRCIKLASKKAKEAGHTQGGAIPEEYWEAAARELNII